MKLLVKAQQRITGATEDVKRLGHLGHLGHWTFLVKKLSYKSLWKSLAWLMFICPFTVSSRLQSLLQKIMMESSAKDPKPALPASPPHSQIPGTAEAMQHASMLVDLEPKRTLEGRAQHGVVPGSLPYSSLPSEDGQIGDLAGVSPAVAHLSAGNLSRSISGRADTAAESQRNQASFSAPAVKQLLETSSSLQALPGDGKSTCVQPPIGTTCISLHPHSPILRFVDAAREACVSMYWYSPVFTSWPSASLHVRMMGFHVLSYVVLCSSIAQGDKEVFSGRQISATI